MLLLPPPPPLVLLLVLLPSALCRVCVCAFIRSLAPRLFVRLPCALSLVRKGIGSAAPAAAAAAPNTHLHCRFPFLSCFGRIGACSDSAVAARSCSPPFVGSPVMSQLLLGLTGAVARNRERERLSRLNTHSHCRSPHGTMGSRSGSRSAHDGSQRPGMVPINRPGSLAAAAAARTLRLVAERGARAARASSAPSWRPHCSMSGLAAVCQRFVCAMPMSALSAAQGDLANKPTLPPRPRRLATPMQPLAALEPMAMAAPKSFALAEHNVLACHRAPASLA